jgi:hypothetical protein
MNKRLIVAAIFVALGLLLLMVRCDPKVLKIEILMWAKNHKSMNFYGKIIDQNNRPVEGVKVTAGVGTFEGPTRSGGKYYYTVSDAEGRFSFTGIHGAGCGYTLKKEGCEFDQRLPCASRPKDFVPDTNKPVIFPIWKLRGAEPLLRTEVYALLACDGTPKRLDPSTGRRDSGDLIVTYTRTPLNVEQGQPFDGILTLEIPNGGLVETTDLYPYEAPAGGYQPSVTITMTATPRLWGEAQRSYYIFDGKRYGRITLDFNANFVKRPASLELQSYVNPSGSRNLEFDRAKQINR